MNPEGLTGCVGEIAILNVYDVILGADEIQSAFDAVATSVGTPPPPFAVKEVVRDENALTLTWDSVAGSVYGAQFSTTMDEWFDLAGPFTATGDEMTESLVVPPNQPAFFVRIGVQQ